MVGVSQVVKKQLIMEKALELFAENGFEATSVQQITERCGISKGAFYLHFKSKDELINSLIDQFMFRIIDEIEQAVSSDKPKEELLFNYVYISFKEFQQQANFAKVFMKEQVLSFNKELLEKMHLYMTIFNKILLSIIQRQFTQMNPNMYLDIVFTINGLMKSYSQLFLLNNYKADLSQLCKSIVEKVTIIAEQAKIQSIPPHYLSCINHVLVISKEHLLESLDQTQKEIEHDPVIKDSLRLLRDHLLEPKLNTALISGLVKNIKENSQCKWVAYQYQLYLQSEENR